MKVMEQYSFRNLSKSHNHGGVFKCHKCPYTTTQAGNLQQHIYNHEGIKPFKCAMCPYSSAFQSALIRHNKTHNNPDKVGRSHCHFSTHQSSALKRHLLTRHGELAVTEKQSRQQQ